jgi:hypothetical protein
MQSADKADHRHQNEQRGTDGWIPGRQPGKMPFKVPLRCDIEFSDSTDLHTQTVAPTSEAKSRGAPPNGEEESLNWPDMVPRSPTRQIISD